MSTRRVALAAVAVIAVVAVATVALVGHPGNEEVGPPAPAPGASLGENALEGGALGVPGELTGVGGLDLVVKKGRSYTLESWRFRDVSPRGTPIAYRVRPADAYGGTSCPSSGLGFDSDGPTARRDGDIYPCRIERPGTQRASASRSWEMIAVFWASRTPGTVMRMADPEAIVRDDAGRRFRVTGASFSQSFCVMGGAACARWLAADGGFPAAEARNKIRLICRLPRRPPVFADSADRPKNAEEPPLGTDAAGHSCSPAGR